VSLPICSPQSSPAARVAAAGRREGRRPPERRMPDASGQGRRRHAPAARALEVERKVLAQRR
jgi:hypothetical protein